MNYKCPTCAKASNYDKKKQYRPFCSEKCKLIDLGAWATEKFKIIGDNNQIKQDDQINEI